MAKRLEEQAPSVALLVDQVATWVKSSEGHKAIEEAAQEMRAVTGHLEDLQRVDPRELQEPVTH